MPVRYNIDSSTYLDSSRSERLQRVNEYWSRTYNRLDDDDNDDESDTEEDNDTEEDDDNEEEDETLGIMMTDDETVTEPRSEFHRLTTMSNTELLEDLAAIVRILRQINSLHRIFNSSNTPDDQTLQLMEPDEGVDEEASKLLEEGLADLQTVLTTEHRRQSTLALLALLTYQQMSHHDAFLKYYLDANGEYNPTLAMFAAVTYDDEIQEPKCCRDIINAAEELCGPDWLEEFQRGKESALKCMLDKLSFVAKIRLKVRDISEKVIR
ncbi:hypothetical protein K501DRAFT_243549 [Backusella circina FSU 941]|nr:hypothetical protein K501DRAFT_243549 [Backusella circina FSU 941]